MKIKRSIKKVKKIMLLVSILFLLMLSVPMVNAQGENIYENINIWRITTKPWTDLFQPVPGLFFAFLMGITTLGVYMKTHSTGAVVVILTVFGLLLADLIPGPGSFVLRVFISVMCAVLLFLLYKGR